MKQNKFDLVMDYIDANILQDVETIKKGIFNLIGYSSLAFGNCFVVLTNQTLFHYISERKMYFAAQALKTNLDRSIADIALEYGYSEQSAFSRAFKLYCKTTPNEVRKGKAYVSNNKYSLSMFVENNNNNDTRFASIVKELNETGDISISNWRYLEMMEEVSQECIFDIDTCSAIFDLAERLEIPYGALLNQCEVVAVHYYADPDFHYSKFKKIMECDISSDDELEAICNFYNCKYYDLDIFMVNAFRDQFKSK